MKIREHIQVYVDDIRDFLKEHLSEDIRVEEIYTYGYKISYVKEYTNPEFHMAALRTLVDTPRPLLNLTAEEKNAIEYAIGAIKTLVDMGVLT